MCRPQCHQELVDLKTAVHLIPMLGHHRFVDLTLELHHDCVDLTAECHQVLVNLKTTLCHESVHLTIAFNHHKFVDFTVVVD